MARYLSRADLSHIAGKYIDQYYTRFGISKDDPEPIDPERLASSVLGLNVKMLPLCSDGSILGLTVFQKCGFTVTLGDGTKLVEVFMPKDVVIDSALASDSCTGCRNFTIAHEAAHHILADLFPNDYGKAVKCRGHIAYRERNGRLRSGSDYSRCRSSTENPSTAIHWTSFDLENNMTWSNNRSFKSKPLNNIQQAQFSIGWRFCPVCGHKLYQKNESCSGSISIKCLKCGNIATVDLAYRRR